MLFGMFNMLITIGAMATMRESEAPVSHVVQPRLEAPETKNPEYYV